MPVKNKHYNPIRSINTGCTFKAKQGSYPFANDVTCVNDRQGPRNQGPIDKKQIMPTCQHYDKQLNPDVDANYTIIRLIIDQITFNYTLEINGLKFKDENRI